MVNPDCCLWITIVFGRRKSKVIKVLIVVTYSALPAQFNTLLFNSIMSIFTYI